MIHGTGIDIVEIARIRGSLEKYPGHFEEKIFTLGEIHYCRKRPDPAKHFAARFAVKEAVLKALGIGISGIGWKDMETANDPETGKPSLRMHGKGRELFENLGIKAIHISISHDDTYAVAHAIAET
jgi:holo-[acyl-carrier protein] synthase